MGLATRMMMMGIAVLQGRRPPAAGSENNSLHLAPDVSRSSFYHHGVSILMFCVGSTQDTGTFRETLNPVLVGLE